MLVDLREVKIRGLAAVTLQAVAPSTVLRSGRVLPPRWIGDAGPVVEVGVGHVWHLGLVVQEVRGWASEAPGVAWASSARRLRPD